jgi:hypothetical protein
VVDDRYIRWLRTAVAKTSWKAIRDDTVVKILFLGPQNCFPCNWVSCKVELQLNHTTNIVSCMCMRDYRRGFGLDIGFIDHLYTRLGSTSKYSVTAYLHNSHITTAHGNSLPACCVFNRSLVTTSNNWDSSASALKSSLNGGALPTSSFLHRIPYTTDSVAPVLFFITSRYEARRQHRSF